MRNNLLKSLLIYASIALVRAVMYFSYWLFSNIIVSIIYLLIMIVGCFYLGKVFLRDTGGQGKNFLSVLPVSIVIVIIGMILLVDSANNYFILICLNPFYELLEMTISHSKMWIYIAFSISEMLVPVLLTLGIKAGEKQRAKQEYF